MKPDRPISFRIRLAVMRFARRFGGLFLAPERLLTTLAIFTGLITGLGALAFSELIGLVEWIYFAVVGAELARRELLYVLLPLLPMSGALLVGLITHFFAPEAEGHGVPEVMDAMARKGGRIRPRVAGAKAVASALTIGSGGSAGTEGPIIQIGAAIGSGLGQSLQASVSDMRVLIGCGAAAGIASIFNAPIAGVLFAVEVLLRDVTLRNFVPIIVAAVLSSTVTQAVRGHNDAIFPIPAEVQVFTGEPAYVFSVQEAGNYAVLGLICGLVAVAFIKLLYGSEDLFRRLPVHRVLRPVLGALLLGGVALGTAVAVEGRMPQTSHRPPVAPEAEVSPVLGNGYATINRALHPVAHQPTADPGVARWTIGVFAVLLVGKVLATCLTLGSGGSGGVFAPSLYIGAMVGGAFGLAMQATGWFPNLTPGAYALVGMAAVVAATIHAPLTATLILFELTRDYKVVVPIMLAAVIGIAVAQRFEPASIYTLKLIRRGVRLASGDLLRLQRITVRDIPRLAAPTVPMTYPVDRLVYAMRTSAANDFVVVDDTGRYAGMVLGDDLRTMLLESEAMPLLTVSDVMRDDVPTVGLTETLDVVLEKFAGRPVQALPVLSGEGSQDAAELLTRAAVMNRYNQSLGSPAGGRR